MTTPLFSSIIQLELAPFVRKMQSAFQTAARSFSQREGILFRIKNSSGDFLYAEASPLPGYSQETMVDITRFLSGKTSGDLFSLYEKSADKLPASLAMALDCLEQQLDNNVENISSIHTNAVFPLNASREENVSLFKQFFLQGYRVFKLKISPQREDEVYSFMRDVLDSSSEGVSFRLDANNSYSSQQMAGDMLKRFSPFPIEYCEDIGCAELTSTLIPLAVDQDLSSLMAVDSFLQKKAEFIYILKPTCLGGLKKTKEAIHRIQKNGKRFVLTSALETEVGRRALIRFALRENLSDETHGFSTGRFFQESFFSDEANFLNVPQVSSKEKQWLMGLAWEKI